MARITAVKRVRFLDALARHGNVSEAARRSGLSRAHAYVLRDKDENFARAWDGALEEAVDALVLEARRRAVDGVEQPVFYRGRQVGSRRVYSDRLLQFLIAAHRPEVYGAARRDRPAPAPRGRPETPETPEKPATPTVPPLTHAGVLTTRTVDGEELVYERMFAVDPKTGKVVVTGTRVLVPHRLADLWETKTKNFFASRQKFREIYARTDGKPP